KIHTFYYCWVSIVVVDADKIEPILVNLYSIVGTKCRRWIRSPRRNSGSARHWLGSMHSARSSAASSTNWRRPSVCSRATAKPPRQEGEPEPLLRPWLRQRPLQRDDADDSALQPENRLARVARRRWGIRSLPWQPAKRSRKSPLHAKALAQT